MSHIQSHHSGADEGHDTYLVILKVHGDAIHLWNEEKSANYSLSISCRNVETHPNQPASNIQMFILKQTIDDIVDDADKCQFQDQDLFGEQIQPNDLITFMTDPVDSSRKASYAIDLYISNRGNQNKNNSNISNNINGIKKQQATFINYNNNNNILNHNNSDSEDLFVSVNGDDGNKIEGCEKVGTAYVYLDSKFSSQGIQRTPIIANNHVPTGQIQIEYLIATNPIAYGKRAPKPDWLFTSQVDAGHRGAGSGRRLDLPDELLENTIASFNYAHRHGADMCELDVVLSADGIPVVYHDFDVDAVAAQQSPHELGKFRVQVNELSLKQMRDFRLLALHDEEGCPYTLNVKNQAESNRPFPTLAEVLNQIDETCGLNIELKWPQQLEDGRMEARKYREINDFVDRIINVVNAHARNRKIVLESFDADLVILLRLKQDRFPVVFLSQGMTEIYPRYMDVRARSIKCAIYFARAFDLAGIDLIMEYFITFGKKLVNFMNNHNLIARTWGDVSEEASEKLDYLKSIGLQCITYDKIDLVKQQREEQQLQLQQ